jgi:hypothetical protein
VVCHDTLFGGAANLDGISFPTKRFTGLRLRLFAPVRTQWPLNRASSLACCNRLPSAGEYDNGRGEFYGDDTHEGTPVQCRCICSQITPASAHWEQAFSSDAGQSWETNWIMDFRGAGKVSA